MKHVVTLTVLAAFAVPALADESQPQDAQLDEQEVVTTAEESGQASERLRAIERIVITAAKEQPAEHAPSERTAALLAEILEEE